MIRNNALLPAFVGVLGFLVGGCGIGPPLLQRDRIDYQVAISESWKKQMLLNIVKLRYADAPVFLEVASIINQQSLEGRLSGLGVLYGPVWSHRQEYSGYVTAYDRPTVTYAPLTGAKFAQQLLAPLPPATILSMVQSGWPVDFVLRLTCDSVNGVRNTTRAAMNRHQADPQFEDLLAALRRIQMSDTIGIRIVQTEKGAPVAKVFLGRKATKDIEEDLLRVHKILGVDTKDEELRLVYGAVPVGEGELSILSRSVLQIVSELAACVEVPRCHLERGLAPSDAAERNGQPLIRIRSGRIAPIETAAAVAYKGYSFWVADDDFESKRMLSLLMLFFSLTESGTGANAPTITVSAGG